ncbi:hypothetical protein BDB00DRAFT_900526, partial [Zychaea mexicana]|uniref:uncharacterized protein n=1 Tax=Zychaea mexicana TaxID=64656 RepID=UPI0022FE3656
MGFWLALRTYRAFIQPILEYGLAITALSAAQLKKIHRAQNSCIKMTFNRNITTSFPTIVPLVLANLPSMQTLIRKIQLNLHDNPPNDAVELAISQKGDGEIARRRSSCKAIRCLKPLQKSCPHTLSGRFSQKPPSSHQMENALATILSTQGLSLPSTACETGALRQLRIADTTTPAVVHDLQHYTNRSGQRATNHRPYHKQTTTFRYRIVLWQMEMTWPALL